MAGIWVFAETVDGTPTPVVLELLTKARSLGEVTAVALGPSASKSVETLGTYGARKVYVHEDPAAEVPSVSTTTMCSAMMTTANTNGFRGIATCSFALRQISSYQKC